MSLTTVYTYHSSDKHPLKYAMMSHVEKPKDSMPALWYVPGLGGSVMGAIPFLTPLLERFSVIYGTDLCGFGLNAQYETRANAQDMLQDLQQFYSQVVKPAGHSHLVLCGISLGGVLATLLTSQKAHWFNALVLLAPAYQANPACFTFGYKVSAILKMILLGHRATMALPYDINHVTQNPDILNDPDYANSPRLVVSPKFLLQIETLARLALKKINVLSLPVYMVIPLQDKVCCPVTMKQAFAQLPENRAHVCQEGENWYHDVTFERERETITQALLRWHAGLLL